MYVLIMRIAATLLIGLSASLPAADWYVDVQNGNDTAGNGSSQAPWKTITHALTQIGGGSQTVFVRPGVYDTSAGETFPILVQAGTTLQSTDGPDETTVRGAPSLDVIHIVGSGQDAAVIGFHVENGRAGFSLRFDSAVVAVIMNNTITANSLAGIEAGAHPSSQLQGIEIIENRIDGNGVGLLTQGTEVGIQSRSNLFTGNSSHGLSFSGRVLMGSESDVIRSNGGWGLYQNAADTGEIRTSLTNTTISGNQSGGVYTFADQFCQYIPYIGWFCFDPGASVQARLCTVYGNGGDGLRRAGTSAGSYGFFSNSIAWGNTGIDNVNFKDVECDIGTGSMIHPDSFSLPPQFVDPQNGDFRLRKSSPCLELVVQVASYDIEGEVRDFDSDSDGLGRSDIGADEFHPFVAPGTRAVIGQPFWFFSEAPPADDGQLVFVMISTADGEDSGGIPVPGSQGQRVDLAPDWLFQLGLTVQPALSGTLQNGFAQTATVTLPNSTQFLGPVYYAGATIDLVAGQFKYIMPTHQFSIATQ